MRYITLTGADEKTDISALHKLANEHSQVLELGFLYTEDRNGTGFSAHRYPRRAWIKENIQGLPRVSLHLCGKQARREFGSYRLNNLVSDFQRIQVNGVLSVEECEKFCSMYKDKTIITQFNEHNIYHLFVKAPNHALLIDSSGGRGFSPHSWSAIDSPKPIGYAGGLGPHNLTGELKNIISVASPNNVENWVDMEGKIRIDNLFSIDLARNCIEQFVEGTKK